MHTQSNQALPAKTWFYVFLTAHLILWTTIPALVRANLPLDAIEGTIWGHQLEWGYDKNPFLNGWLTALAGQLSSSGWALYFFSQLSVAACFWAVWQLGNRLLTPVYALIAVLLLETLQYFNLHAIDFNDNTLELGLWGLTIYFFYNATQHNQSRKILAWILTGLFAALGMMAKYYTAALLAGMFLFLLIEPNSRKQFKTVPPYLGLLTFSAIILPHVIWLFFHDFITVKYVFARADSLPSWTNHFYFPAQFAWQQLEVLLPALILFSCLFIGKKPRLTSAGITLNHFNKTFLLCVCLGPFLLTLLLSLLLGTNLRAGWGMPLLSFWGIILIALFPPRMSSIKFYGFLSSIFIFMFALLAGYSISLLDSDTPSSANFPGKKIANVVTQEWQNRFHTPLTYVAGSRWVGGNIGFYSKDHPAVYIEWNAQHAPWINLESLHEKGGVFIWSISDNETLPENIKKQFPQLEPMRILKFSWQRNHHHLQPIQIGLAFLPPRSDEYCAH